MPDFSGGMLTGLYYVATGRTPADELEDDELPNADDDEPDEEDDSATPNADSR